MKNNIKIHAREMFDKKFPQAYSCYDAREGYEEDITSDIKDLIDQIIDLTIAARDKEIVKIIKKEKEKLHYLPCWNDFLRGEELGYNRIINIINNTETDKQ